MTSVKDFIEWMKKEAGIKNATDFNLVEAYRTFFIKVIGIASDKSVDAREVNNIDEAAELNNAEWIELQEEFDAIHSEHQERLREAIIIHEA